MFGIDWTKEIREAAAAGTATTIQSDISSPKYRESAPCIGTNLRGTNGELIEQIDMVPNTHRVAAGESIRLSVNYWKYDVNGLNKCALRG